MDMTLAEIAGIVGGELHGDGSLHITGLNGIKEARAGDLTFYADPRYSEYLESTPASALLVQPDFPGNSRPVIHVASPYHAFAQLLHYLEAKLLRHPAGIHTSAAIASSASLGRDVGIDAHVVIAEGAKIGDRTVLYAGVYVGRDTVIGPDCVIYPHVTLRERVEVGARCIIHANTTIGTDGFGYAGFGATRVKIPQIGGVILADDVEIGSNTAIDRATTGDTTIGRGTKIDNLVQIGHNVSIGEHCAISGSVGISGSARIGNNVLIGGQAGINGHIEIGDGCIIAGQTGVHKDLPPGSVVAAGNYHREAGLTRRIHASLSYLPDLLKRFRKLEKRVESLEK